MDKNDKLKALDAALAQIEKQHGKGSIMKLGDSNANMNIETVPTGSLSLDIALGACFVSSVASSLAIACSGASTIKVAPCNVSGLVV